MNSSMDIRIRKAADLDIKEIKKILSSYFLDTGDVEKDLPGFLVADSGENIAGCACLDIGIIAELKSIAVLPALRNKGIGSRLVDAVLERAAGVANAVYLRTASPVFFEKKGAKRLANDEKEALWKECRECDKSNICMQVIMRFGLKK